MNDKLYWYRGRCVNVVDGDTLDIEINLGFKIYVKERIRLYGINSNEIFGVKIGSDEYVKGMVCKARVQELVINKDIWINTIKDKQEKYGRYLAVVFLVENDNLINLNDILLNEGLAKIAVY